MQNKTQKEERQMKAAGSEKSCWKAQNTDSELVASEAEAIAAEMHLALLQWLGLPTLAVLLVLAVAVITGGVK